MKKKRKFTLVELLAVMGIITILAGIAIGVVQFARKKTGEARTTATLEIIKMGLEQYKQKYGYYLPISGGEYVEIHTDYVDSANDAKNNNKGNFNQFIDYNALIGQGKASGVTTGRHCYYIKDGFGAPIYYCYPGKINRTGYDLGSCGPNNNIGAGGVKISTESNADGTCKTATPDADDFETFGQGDDITNCKR